MVMMIPVAILAVLAVVGGFIQTRALGVGPALVSDFLDKSTGAQNWEENGFAVLLGLATMLLGAALFVGALWIKPWSARVPWAQRILEHKYYFDEAYDAIFVRPLDRTADVGLRDVEDRVIDGAVLGTGGIAEAGAGSLSLTETGYFRNYVLVFVAGVIIIAILLLARFAS
jgi:NADH-quinone oxidoreductase subunit L